MLYVKLQTLRNLNEEISRLEAIRSQMQKCKSYEKKEAYAQDLKECKEERNRLIKEDPLNGIFEETEREEQLMARYYYYKGFSWEQAFTRMTSELEIYLKCTYDERNKHIREKKKYITRKVQKYYKYYPPETQLSRKPH